MSQRRNPLDRLDDYFEKVWEWVEAPGDHQDPSEVSPIHHKWWFVANRVTTGMVITDQQRRIVIAPVQWNRFLGMTIDALLEQVHAQAVSIPGPHPEARR